MTHCDNDLAIAGMLSRSFVSTIASLLYLVKYVMNKNVNDELASILVKTRIYLVGHTLNTLLDLELARLRPYHTAHASMLVKRSKRARGIAVISGFVDDLLRHLL